MWQLYVSFRIFNNEKPINVAISSENFASFPILSLNLPFFEGETSGETDFWAFSLKAVESGCKIGLSLKKKNSLV